MFEEEVCNISYMQWAQLTNITICFSCFNDAVSSWCVFYSATEQFFCKCITKNVQKHTLRLEYFQFMDKTLWITHRYIKSSLVMNRPHWICALWPPAGVFMGQSQFNPQGFTPGMPGAAVPTTMMGGGAVMPGMALPNGGYMGVMPANQQNMFNMQQGQWSVNQVTGRLNTLSGD